MYENPYAVPTYCRYCAYLKRFDEKDSLGRPCKVNYCEVNDRYYSDNSIRRSNNCECYQRGDGDALYVPRDNLKERDKVCKKCGRSHADVSGGLCQMCKDKLPIWREIKKMLLKATGRKL